MAAASAAMTAAVPARMGGMMGIGVAALGHVMDLAAVVGAVEGVAMLFRMPAMIEALVAAPLIAPTLVASSLVAAPFVAATLVGVMIPGAAPGVAQAAGARLVIELALEGLALRRAGMMLVVLLAAAAIAIGH